MEIRTGHRFDRRFGNETITPAKNSTEQTAAIPVKGAIGLLFFRSAKLARP
jgi:hypothetical protein